MVQPQFQQQIQQPIPPQYHTFAPQQIQTPQPVQWHAPQQEPVRLESYVNVVPPIAFMPVTHPLDPRNFHPNRFANPATAQQFQQFPVGEDYFEPQMAQPEPAPSLESAIQEAPSRSRSVNRVFGFNALLLSRENFNDSVNISNLNTRSVDQNDAVAFDVNLVTRRQGGGGWEARYFGLLDETATNRLAITPGVPLSGSNAITRDTEIHNVEFNFVKQRQSRFLGIPVSNNETIHGVRALHFSESLLFQTDAINTGFSDIFPRTENLLIGLQIGRRIDKQLFGRFGTTGYAKLGVYNNRAEIRNQTFSDTKDDVSFIGEADFAGTYQFNSNVRAKVGYRVLAITDLAIADSHLNTTPFVPGSTEINTSDDLYLAGGYFGFEFVH